MSPRRKLLVVLVVIGEGFWLLSMWVGVDWAIPITAWIIAGAFGARIGIIDSRQKSAIERATYLPYKPGGQTVQVRRYKSIQQYEIDARRRMAVGWTIEGQSVEPGGISLPGTAAKYAVFHPWAAVSPSCHLPVLRDHPVASYMGPPRAHFNRST
jgi:hypothetical protein